MRKRTIRTIVLFRQVFGMQKGEQVHPPLPQWHSRKEVQLAVQHIGAQVGSALAWRGESPSMRPPAVIATATANLASFLFTVFSFPEKPGSRSNL
jgi:hypothetical protein